ncbi:MAG: HupE/UreJ family protein [Armatimonadetes bacterium]|nr:HupE/UreJ family protein [Armatimonadota bacterium]
MRELVALPARALAPLMDEAGAKLKAGLVVLTDKGQATLTGAVIPTPNDVAEWIAGNGKNALPVMLHSTLRFKLPADAKTISLRFPKTLGSVVLTTELPGVEPIAEPVESGTASMVLDVPVGSAPSGSSAVTASTSHDETKGVRAAMAGSGTILSPSVAPNSGGLESRPGWTVGIDEQPPFWPVLWRYVKMGFEHILPQGLDHVLFVLGLFLLGKRPRDLIKQITAFTLAHSLTLALALFGVIRLPSIVVEPLIAASIAFVAIENIVTKDLKPWRVYVVFGFGLLHGLGFAGALQETGLQNVNFVTALIGFNGGVELGQLTVVGLAFLAVGWFREKEKYRSYVTVPASVAISLVALFWTVQRIFFV